MHCIHWRAQRNLWLISTQEESILLVYRRLFDHQHYHRFAQKHVIWIFFFCLVVSSSSAQLGTKDKNSMWDNTERPGHQHLSPLGVLLKYIVSLTNLCQRMWCFDIRNWPKKQDYRLNVTFHLSTTGREEEVAKLDYKFWAMNIYTPNLPFICHSLSVEWLFQTFACQLINI